MTTSRAMATEVSDFLDYLFEADLAAYINRVRLDGTVVAWHELQSGQPFLLHHGDTKVSDYLHWLASGHYSALLSDGALLQIRYEVAAGFIAGHRLAYIPCPFNVDPYFLEEYL